MTSEEDFQRALDADPDDHHTRLVLADWLDERGDPRGPGYRALGVNRLRPVFQEARPTGGNWWLFHNGTGSVMSSHPRYATVRNRLPLDWFEAASDRNRDINYGIWLGYTATRRGTEDAVALAFAKLPPERRAALLNPGAEAPG